MDVLTSVMHELLKVPVSFPRYYFQSLQTTSVKVSSSVNYDVHGFFLF